MATGTLQQFQIYEEQFFSGLFEVLEDNVTAFNQASAGCLNLTTEFMKGQFEASSFFQKPANLIQHRDPTQTGDASATGMSQGETKGVKINKRIGPVENTIDSFKKAGIPLEEMAFVLGQQCAPDIQQSYLSSAISSLVGLYGVGGMSGLIQDSTSDSTATLKHIDLVKGLSKFGDAANNVRLWVMHSKTYFDLIGYAVTEKLLEVTAGVLYGGTPGTLGRPVLVTDCAALLDSNGTSGSSSDDFYWTFGLTGNSVNVKESEERSMLIEVVGGKQNLIARYQGEFAYNVDVKGTAFTGSANPTDTALASAANWSKVYASLKSMPGVAIKTK